MNKQENNKQQRPNNKEQINKIKTLVSEVRSNNKKILYMKKIGMEKYKEAKKRVKFLIQNSERISLDDIERIRESIEVIKNGKLKLSSSNSGIFRFRGEVRKAIVNKNYQEINKKLVSYIKYQKEQKEILKQMNREFELIKAINWGNK